jgi:triphosphoribosyl-dephospho-CoA synthase
MVQALLATVASLDDTNLAHRGGVEGLRFAQSEASAFLAADGVLRAGWRERARAMHQAFIARRLSPGGAADLLACAWWVDHLTVASRSAS